MLPHSRKAARGVIMRDVVGVVGGFVVTLQAGGGVVPCLEGCTLVAFLAEHRGSAHGPPRHSTAISTAFHGQPRTLHGLPRTLHGLPRTFHGLPRNVAASSGTPWRPMALAMAISAAISKARSTAISTAISTASHGKHPRLTMASRGTTERSTASPVERPTACLLYTSPSPRD